MQSTVIGGAVAGQWAGGAERPDSGQPCRRQIKPTAHTYTRQFKQNPTDVAGTAYQGILSVGGTTVNTGATLFSNSTHLLLTKVTLNYEGVFDRVQFWIDPDVSMVAANGEAGLSATTLSIDGADGLGDSLTHAGFALSLPTSAMDALRIGTAGGDEGLNEVLTGVAVPEPSAIALFVIGSAGLLLRRRN